MSSICTDVTCLDVGALSFSFPFPPPPSSIV
jgi:hypothetical protein